MKQRIPIPQRFSWQPGDHLNSAVVSEIPSSSMPSLPPPHHHHQQQQQQQQPQQQQQQQQQRAPWRLYNLFQLNCLLASVGGLTGLVSTAINISVFLLSVLLDRLAQQGAAGLLLSMGLNLIFIWLAAALCIGLAPAAIGSGVSQMKHVLASRGEDVLAAAALCFSIEAGAVKVLGIVLVVVGRLNVGREGAMVQIAGCVAHLLARKVAFFRDVSSTSKQQRQLYAASAAVGIATAFHAPIGGVLFSIEVTGSSYFVSIYWKAFVASVSGMLCVVLLQSSVSKGYILPSTVMVAPGVIPVVSAYQCSELLFFALTGVVGGLLGCGLLRLYSVYRAISAPWRQHRPLLLTLCTGIVTLAVLQFTGLYLRSYSFSLKGLFEYDFLKLGFLTAPLSGRERSFAEYTVLGASQTFVTLIGINCPVPTGSFFPMFIVGACMGRMMARAVRLMEHPGSEGAMNSTQLAVDFVTNTDVPIFLMAQLDPTGYAVVGGVAMTASVTQAISCAVIAVEITDNTNYLLPCLLAAVIASGISKFHGPCLYERALENAELEALPFLLPCSFSCCSPQVAAQVVEPHAPDESSFLSMAEGGQDVKIDGLKREEAEGELTPTSYENELEAVREVAENVVQDLEPPHPAQRNTGAVSLDDGTDAA